VEAEDGREILIPFTRSICKVIDVAEKIIRVEAPEGLLDLK
jgi:ribosomal 30S subunit maturation factor RimM